MKRSLLVTGGLGFIGKNFCLNILNNLNILPDYTNKIIIDKNTYASDLDYYNKNLSNDWELIIDSCANIKNYINQNESYDIIHFAAESHVDNSFTNARYFFQANVIDTLEMLEVLRNNPKNYRLIHISTDEVYGEQVNEPATEMSPLTPTNPYSASKTSADILVQTYKKCFQIDTKIIRANNIYGDYQLVEKVIPKAIFLARQKKQFFLHGSKSLKRHFLHTKDFSQAIYMLLCQWENINYDIFNIAGDNSYFIKDIVKKIYEMSNLDPKHFIKTGDDRPFNDTEYKVNDKIIRSLGWSPKVDFWDELKDIHLRNAVLEGFVTEELSK